MRFPCEFTNEEISSFLVDTAPRYVPETLLVMTQRDKSPVPMHLQDVEKLFRFTYRPTLTFASREEFLWVTLHCPFLLRFSSIATEHHEMFALYKQELREGVVVPTSIRWIDPIKEYGLVAEKKIASGTFVGEYTGLVRRLSRLRHNTNSYCFCYPTLLWSMRACAIDGQKYGNVMRFVNHSDDPNLEPRCLVDRGLLHMAFFAKKEIAAGEELTFDYGPEFWRHRQKRNP